MPCKTGWTRKEGGEEGREGRRKEEEEKRGAEKHICHDSHDLFILHILPMPSPCPSPSSHWRGSGWDRIWMDRDLSIMVICALAFFPSPFLPFAPTPPLPFPFPTPTPCLLHTHLMMTDGWNGAWGGGERWVVGMAHLVCLTCLPHLSSPHPLSTRTPKKKKKTFWHAFALALPLLWPSVYSGEEAGGHTHTGGGI